MASPPWPCSVLCFLPASCADGEPCVDFDTLISQLVELVLSLVGSQRYAALLRASLGDLLRLALGYMQMTAAQVERWAADPNVYVADEEEDFSTVRCVGGSHLWGAQCSRWTR